MLEKQLTKTNAWYSLHQHDCGEVAWVLVTPLGDETIVLGLYRLKFGMTIAFTAEPV
tara:strand:- start:1220 stop:1390 length:171 start_codon:yes stop_codon:yes gene_type:complete